jgi:hypothetical protein
MFRCLHLTLCVVRCVSLWHQTLNYLNLWLFVQG